MPVETIRIEERLWSSALPLRKQDWCAIITDVLEDDPPWPSRESCTLIVGCDDTQVRFVLTGSTVADESMTFARADISPLVDEYVGLIKRLTGGDLHSAQMEAIDMAKRVVHDAGGRRISALLPEVGPSFETQRCLFSLVVSLLVDTTRLGPIPAHRQALVHPRRRGPVF
jgi:hypothetical protein